jgi:ethanolamine ammonia-lyase small subunit
MEHEHAPVQPQKAATPATVALTPVAAETLDAIVLILREVGFRVKTAALVEAALVELKEQMSEPGKAVEIVRRRVPPHSVVFPP